MNQIYFKVLVLLIFLSPVFGQTSMSSLDKSNLKIFNEAIKLARQGKHKDAIKKYDKVIKKYPSMTEAVARKAASFYDLGDKPKALETYKQAIQIEPNFSPELYYASAIISDELGDNENTLFMMKQYLSMEKIKTEKYLKAEKIKNTAAFRIESQRTKTNIDIYRLNDSINTASSEYLPAFTADGLKMVFTRRQFGQEDLLISSKLNDDWSKPIEIIGINTKENEGAHTISVDGKTIIYTVCNRKEDYGSCDLYMSHLKDGRWEKPKNLGPRINSKSWEAQPCLTADGTSLFFSSNRPGGLGGNDIWMSSLMANGSWSSPTNVGNDINTSGNEESPFIHPDGQTMYFRSDGHVTIGSFDILMSKYNIKTQNWSPPFNPGYPINSEGSDGALSVTLDGKYAFFATDRASFHDKSTTHPNSNLDIFYFKLPEKLKPEAVSFVNGTISSKESNVPLFATIVVVDINNNDTLITSNSDEQGNFLFTLPIGKNYSFHTSKDGYLFHSENFNTTDLNTKYNPYTLKIQLQKIESKKQESPIILNNIFFDSGASVLLPQSFAEIDYLVTLLKTNASKKIKIIGHTDNVGNEQDNLDLSKSRAKAVMDALTSKGIPAHRVLHEGKGESQPIASNDSELGRKLNRRTEFVLE